ncbi:MAG TPA: abortive phage resistance protein, partial [Nannocystis exedens]|nr:abortive phage resistance protein [Nannocystis exedens]
MSFASQIIDLHVQALAERHRAEFEGNLGITGDQRVKSAAFVLLAVKTYSNISEEEALDRITEGGNDFGIDAIDHPEEIDGEYTVTLFQGKYKHKLNANANFPRTGVEKMLIAVKTLLDPDRRLTLMPRLRVRIEEIRSLVRDGAIPRVQVVLCNNGNRWDTEGQELIDNADLGDQVSWSHVNHDSIISILRAPKDVDEALQLTGKAHIESFGYRRVLVGRVSVSEIAQIFEKHGDRLLERNIRRDLGLHGSRVNRGIEATLLDEKDSSNFYFYNNGITITCDQFRVNQLQSDNWRLRLSKMQVINGGQTCQTIKTVLRAQRGTAADATVMVRIYELPEDDRDFVQAITYATNSQNPVDLRDLKSNDPIQKHLEVSLEKLGYTYRRQRSETSSTSKIVSSKVAAEATLAIWRQRPHQAKFRTTEHFGTLYDTIFTKDLNGAQVVLAVLLLRFAENRRKRPPEDAALFLQYASC